jgi:5'-deoxynucleotidase YfbR-like HD superfamily hydrolase
MTQPAYIFAIKGGNVKRYHTAPTIMQDTVAHHSFNVCMMIMALDPLASAALLRAGLQHDIAEHKLGDMPSPAKRAMRIRELFQQHEEAHMKDAGISPEILTKGEEWVLKVSDALDGMRFCVQERAMGNQLIWEPYFNFQSYVEQLLEGVPTDGDQIARRAYKFYEYFKADWRASGGQ